MRSAISVIPPRMHLGRPTVLNRSDAPGRGVAAGRGSCRRRCRRGSPQRGRRLAGDRPALPAEVRLIGVAGVGRQPGQRHGPMGRGPERSGRSAGSAGCGPGSPGRSRTPPCSGDGADGSTARPRRRARRRRAACVSTSRATTTVAPSVASSATSRRTKPSNACRWRWGSPVPSARRSPSHRAAGRADHVVERHPPVAQLGHGRRRAPAAAPGRKRTPTASVPEGSVNDHDRSSGPQTVSVPSSSHRTSTQPSGIRR